MNLPLLLAGPILRRVDTTTASVWLALRDPSKVVMKVWEGRAKSGQAHPLAASPSTPTLRLGAKLNVVVVTVEIPATAGVSFQPDAVYSYDVEITNSRTLRARSRPCTCSRRGFFDGFARLPLGFEPDFLPTFAPPPSDLTNLRVLYGSCRRPGHPTVDALALVDDLIFDHDKYKDARTRPHQLFLGGDQIYADDVLMLHMLLVEAAAVPLIGSTGSAEFPDPIEFLPLDQIQKLVDETKAKDPHPLEGYADELPGETAKDPFLPADRDHFPEGRKLNLTIFDAQLTSEDGDSHVLSIGEFAALYLSVWSSAIWGSDVTGAKFAPDASKPNQNQTFRWDGALPPLVKGSPASGAIVMPPVSLPGAHPRAPVHRVSGRAEEKSDFDREKSQRGNFNVLQQFYRGLPKVQRALANVPTYMILDDHDVTDDYFLNPVWRNRVLEKKLGQAIIGNAMIAYSVFQDWGNDPVSYRTGPKAQLLSLIQKLFPATITKGPDQPTFQQIASLLGHDKPLVQTADSKFASANPPLKWHFMVDGPKHRAIAFDNRTRRSYVTQAGPPGNVSSRRDGGSDPIASASGRPGNPHRYRASSGDRAPSAGRDCRATVVSRVQLCPGDENAEGKAQPALTRQHVGSARDDRHQSRRNRSLGVRRRDLRASAQTARAISQSGAPLRRCALLVRNRHELLEGERDPACPVRAVHLQRIQERDAHLHHVYRQITRLRPAAHPRQPRHRATGLGPAAR